MPVQCSVCNDTGKMPGYLDGRPVETSCTHCIALPGGGRKLLKDMTLADYERIALAAKKERESGAKN